MYRSLFEMPQQKNLDEISARHRSPRMCRILQPDPPLELRIPSFPHDPTPEAQQTPPLRVRRLRRMPIEHSPSGLFSPTRLMRPLPPLPDECEYDLEAQKPFGHTMPDTTYESPRLHRERYTAEDRKRHLQQTSALRKTLENEKRHKVAGVITPSSWWIARKIEAFLEKIADALYDRVEAGQDPEKDLLLPVEEYEREGGEFAKRFADIGYI